MEPVCWKIERVVSKGDYDYAVAKDHPNATKHGYVLMHRIVVENHLGRLLNPEELVHHVNHKKKDNRIENLEVLTSKQHMRLHASGRKMCHIRCPQCKVEFCRAHNLTHLGNGRGKLTFCSRSCKGTFHRLCQLNRLTQTVEAAVSENILLVFKRTTPR